MVSSSFPSCSTRDEYHQSSYNSQSLKTQSYSGLALQNNIVVVLIRFRRFPVAVNGDVSEMYLQVCLNEPDIHFLRFLWRDSTVQEPEVCEFKRFVLGSTYSPCCV